MAYLPQILIWENFVQVMTSFLILNLFVAVIMDNFDYLTRWFQANFKIKSSKTLATFCGVSYMLQ